MPSSDTDRTAGLLLLLLLILLFDLRVRVYDIHTYILCTCTRLKYDIIRSGRPRRHRLEEYRAVMVASLGGLGHIDARLSTHVRAVGSHVRTAIRSTTIKHACKRHARQMHMDLYATIDALESAV